MDHTIYENFLQNGRNELYEFKNTGNSGSTGIESSLIEPYLSEIIDLNKFVNTTESTNKPSELSQGMFLGGWINKEYVTAELCGYLNTHNISYSFKEVNRNLNTCNIFIQNITPDWKKRLIIFDILTKWWYDVDYYIVEPNNYHGCFLMFQSSLKYDRALLFFIEIVKSDFINMSFLELFEKYKNNPNINKFECLNEHIYNMIDCYEENYDYTQYYSSSLYEMTDYIDNHSLIQFNIENLYDPTDRNLYTILLNYFEN